MAIGTASGDSGVIESSPSKTAGISMAAFTSSIGRNVIARFSRRGDPATLGMAAATLNGRTFKNTFNVTTITTGFGMLTP